jgi:anti-sigma B factor antagonist
MKPSKNPDPYALDAAGMANDAETTAKPASSAASDKFSTMVRDNVHIVTLTNENVLDAFEIESLGAALRAYVESSDTANLVIDLSKVEHLSSAALGMLVTLKSTAESGGGSLRLANVRHDLKKIFKLTKLDKVLKIHDDVESAVRSF